MALRRQIGASMNARGKASRWAHDLADSRLAICDGEIGAGENGALARPKSANFRQFRPLAHANATWGQLTAESPVKFSTGSEVLQNRRVDLPLIRWCMIHGQGRNRPHRLFRILLEPVQSFN